MKSLAIIPARGGSTRLKDKNIYPINGKPLIAYTIEAVINSNCFNKIIVSTDSKEISKVANQYDVEIHDRPNEYAGSKVTVLEAILNLMNNI